ncbi:MAG TPA: methyltransferase [Chitinophagaceae bacterium]|nr:methyltransferase [Chitinophagaceae bacterium]
MIMETKAGQQYWDQLYQNKETRWDIGYPSPPLKEYIDQLENKQQSILIPGCGNSYEAGYILARGFTDLTLIDISPSLTSSLEEKFKHYLDKQLQIITGDFFELKGKYDLILEQTFFCALPPSNRYAYMQQMHKLLKPGGKLVGVLFNRLFEEAGPPFGGTVEEYKELFQEKFLIETMELCYNSIEKRMGTEVFIKLIRK